MSDYYTQQTRSFETVLDFIRYGYTQACTTKLYYGHGTDNAWDDIMALVLGSLSLPYNAEPWLLQARLAPDEKTHLVSQLAKRIIDRVPVPYLTKEAFFCELPFYVDERVLIPRSPLAELIQQQFAPWIDADDVAHVLDLCTGSGCIAIACCEAFPDALVDAVDLSDDALDVAEINRERYGLEEQLTLVKSNCFDALPETRYDIIVSNPPYVGRAEMDTLPQEYLHEPSFALEAENDGLAIVEQILFSAHRYLSDHGILIVEVGNSEEALMEAYPEIPFTWLDFEHGGQGVFLLTSEQVNTYCRAE
jgi:ribosomal protein L3 glutamine methyltransferase